MVELGEVYIWIVLGGNREVVRGALERFVLEDCVNRRR